MAISLDTGSIHVAVIVSGCLSAGIGGLSNMDKIFNPTESDCQWTRDMLKKVKIGGLWRTSFGLYKKTS